MWKQTVNGTNSLNLNVSADHEKLRVMEFVSRGPAAMRSYKLTSKTKFERFHNYLASELRSMRMSHVIDPTVRPNEEPNDEQKHIVHDIIINRIDEAYYDQVADCKNQYEPSRESASQFRSKFEEIVWTHDYLSDVTPFTQIEKRDAFFIAIRYAVPLVQQIDFVQKRTTGKGMCFEDLKLYILQAEADSSTRPRAPTAMHAQKRDSKAVRCFNCDDFRHVATNCPHQSTGKKKCYNCNKITNHHSRDCPLPRRPRKRENSNERRRHHNGYDSHSKKRKMTSNGTYNKRSRDYKPESHTKSNDAKKNDGKNSFITNNECTSLFSSFRTPHDELDGENGEDCILARFIADSGATEHLSKSKLYFSILNDEKTGIIRCANSDPSADLKTEGEGNIIDINSSNQVELRFG